MFTVPIAQRLCAAFEPLSSVLAAAARRAACALPVARVDRNQRQFPALPAFRVRSRRSPTPARPAGASRLPMRSTQTSASPGAPSHLHRRRPACRRPRHDPARARGRRCASISFSAGTRGRNPRRPVIVAARSRRARLRIARRIATTCRASRIELRRGPVARVDACRCSRRRPRRRLRRAGRGRRPDRARGGGRRRGAPDAAPPWRVVVVLARAAPRSSAIRYASVSSAARVAAISWNSLPRC